MNAILVDPVKYGRTRDELKSYLYEKGIDSRLLFTSMSEQNSLKKYGCDCSGSYPVTELLSKNGLYLPSASKLKPVEIEYICDVIRGFAK